MARPVDPRQRMIHRLLYAGIALGLLAGIAVMLGQQTATSTMSLAQLEKNLGQDPYHVVVIDVRSPEEYASGHIPFAINVPIDQLPRRVGEFQEIAERQFAMVCESGGRSKKAVELMRGSGYMSVADVPEGTKGWRESGRELVTSSPKPFHDLVQ